MKSIGDLFSEAWEKLRGNWGRGALAVFFLVLVMVACMLVLMFFYALVAPLIKNAQSSGEQGMRVMMCLLVPGVLGLQMLKLALHFGLKRCLLSTVREGVLMPRTVCYWLNPVSRILKVFWVTLVMSVYMLLWGCLLIVPGIMAALSYMLVPWILQDYPKMGANQAIALSKQMMHGHRWQGLGLFVLLQVLGSVIAYMTCNIGLLFVLPYSFAVFALFYEDVKRDYLKRQAISISEPVEAVV